MFTKKGMAIKFPAINVNPMGKIASGVTGISLKEGDSVILGDVLNTSLNDNNKNEIAVTLLHGSLKYKLVSKNKKENRAGRGSSVMLIGFDDEVKKAYII